MLFSYDYHPQYRLVLLANRDEFYRRPTEPLRFWENAPHVLAGRDLEGFGTWLGVTRCGRVAGVTNYREPIAPLKNGRSRGALVSDFLEGAESPSDYMNRIRRLDSRFNGYNLIAGDRSTLYYHSNRDNGVTELDPGIYGLSNHLLNTPWPKVKKGIEALKGLLQPDRRPDLEDFFELLADPAPFPDHTLPDTGIGLDWERILSPLFISSPGYGTRSSAVILIDRNGQATVAERTYDPATTHVPNSSTRCYEFQLES